jgi:hypothetical protein
MATTTTRKPKKLTRADRENARKAAASANASLDLARAGKIALIVVVVAVLVLAVMLVVPSGSSLGGPLQASRLEGASTLTAVPKTKGHPVTFGLSVPWNAGAGIVELEALVPLAADGVQMLRAAVVPLGSAPLPTAKGFPPKVGVLETFEDFPIPPGTSDVDGFQIVVGLKGEGSVPAFALVYRMGGVRYVTIIGHGAMLCAKACEGQDAVEAAQRSYLAGLSPFVSAPVR